MNSLNKQDKHLQLINQFNNIIDLIKGADTEEQIQMLKELPKLDAEKMMNEFEEEQDKEYNKDGYEIIKIVTDSKLGADGKYMFSNTKILLAIDEKELDKLKEKQCAVKHEK